MITDDKLTNKTNNTVKQTHCIFNRQTTREPRVQSVLYNVKARGEGGRGVEDLKKYWKTIVVGGGVAK